MWTEGTAFDTGVKKLKTPLEKQKQQQPKLPAIVDNQWLKG